MITAGLGWTDRAPVQSRSTKIRGVDHLQKFLVIQLVRCCRSAMQDILSKNRSRGTGFRWVWAV